MHDASTGCGISFGKDLGGQLSCSWVRRQSEGNCPSYHQMRYWVLGLVPSPGKALPGEVDRCLTGSRGMIHDVVSRLVRTLEANCHVPGFDVSRRGTAHPIIKCGTGCWALSPAQVKLSRVKWTAA
ncbi:hypothetical protein F2Q69_00040863 [Brassica cretica]|uniref:Uncharacterized protein n=1 Tax=Brassica cretica TaxID=69181 RepID=A0A8S9NKU9_BRACR|nr:hypothetical protein F2Q69_00040863 [Brassica cretica]